MALYARTQVVFHRVSGLAEDDIVNTLHWEGDEGIGGDLRAQWDLDIEGLCDRIDTFYQAIAGWLSPVIGGPYEIKCYDMADAKPRPPRFTYESTIPTTGTDLFPSEVACCLSYAATQEAGVEQRRRRGRIYLGPLRLNSSTWSGTPSDLRVGNPLMDAALDSAVVMAHGGAGAFRLAVFSPTTAGINDTAPAAWNDVKTLWLDNAYDTMRSRGAVATVRGTRTLVS